MKQSFFKKTGMIAVLIILLNIPLGVILGVIKERSAWNDQAHREIAATWGAPQNIAGPVLTIPFYDANGDLQSATFLSDTLEISADVTPEKRYRGIFEVIVYNARVSMSGSFTRPDFSAWGIEPYQVLWDKACVSLGLSDLRAVQEIHTFQWNSTPASLRSGEKPVPGINGLTARLFPDDDRQGQPGDPGLFQDTNPFNIVFTVHGSREIRFCSGRGHYPDGGKLPMAPSLVQGRLSALPKNHYPRGVQGGLAGIGIWPGLSRDVAFGPEKRGPVYLKVCLRHVRGGVDPAGQFLYLVRTVCEIRALDHRAHLPVLFHV